MASSPSLDTRNGACLCKKISYTVSGNPTTSFICHCDNCRPFSGATFAHNLMFKNEQINIADPESVLHAYHDSATHNGSTIQRMFCSNCGSSLFIDNPRFEGFRLVTVGTLSRDDGKESLDIWPPINEVFVRRKQDWVPEFSGTKTVH